VDVTLDRSAAVKEREHRPHLDHLGRSVAVGGLAVLVAHDIILDSRSIARVIVVPLKTFDLQDRAFELRAHREIIVAKDAEIVGMENISALVVERARKDRVAHQAITANSVGHIASPLLVAGGKLLDLLIPALWRREIVGDHDQDFASRERGSGVPVCNA
jgi:hypothetical protein